MASGERLLAVGTFNTPELFIVRYSRQDGRLQSLGSIPGARGTHSWLCLDEEKRRLYATCWSEPACVAAYDVSACASPGSDDQQLLSRCKLIGTARTRARSGYVKAYKRGGSSYLVSISGPSGEIWRLDAATGAFADAGRGEDAFTHIQDIDFVTGEAHARSVDGSRETVPTGLSSNKSSQFGDFGGLRHGAHGVEFSPEGDIAYVPDIGRNCIWVYRVREADGCFELLQKCTAPRPNDGPRHTWSNPNGKLIYSVEEHTSMVDVFELDRSGATPQLVWMQAGQILPVGQTADKFWADEVRLSPPEEGGHPRYLIASTRGLESSTLGYVSVHELDEAGYLTGAGASEISGCRPGNIYQTPTSGGLANAVEPMPQLYDGECHFALTDSDQGILQLLKIGREGCISQAARLPFQKRDDGTVRGLATAVWL